MSTSLPAGGAAEDLVARHLESAGWTILDRRLRIRRLEIDLVARRHDVVAIVEVRGRRFDGVVEPFDTVGHAKRRNLARAARMLWGRRFAGDESVRVVRIDLAAVVWGPQQPGGARVEIAEGAVDPSLR